MIRLRWEGQALELLPSRTVYLPAASALVLSDPHFGKDAAFRAAGLPIPEGATGADVARLDRAVRTSGARCVWILGDLLHARSGRDLQSLDPIRRWRRDNPHIDVTLVRGNHDRWAGDPPTDWAIRVVSPPWTLGALSLCHEPLPQTQASIAGHLHPAVRMVDRDGSSVRLACFHLQGADRRLVLPAFGSFTGGRTLSRGSGDRVFAVTPDEEVIEVPAAIRVLARRGRGAGCSPEAS